MSPGSLVTVRDRRGKFEVRGFSADGSVKAYGPVDNDPNAKRCWRSFPIEDCTPVVERCQCHGTKARYALRCTLLARAGFLTCARHASQEDYWQQVAVADSAFAAMAVTP